jgi:hypothetical protein
MGDEFMMLIAAVFMCAFLVMAGVSAYLVHLKRSGTTSTTSSSTTAGSSAATGTGIGEWQKANATRYTSYPSCCKDSDNYDPKADKTECTKYSGCKWAGQFAGLDKKIQASEVAKRNIVAYYDAKNQSGNAKKAQSWWNSNVKGKKIELKMPSGTTMIVEALDTCSDGDTKNNDCTKNANKNGGGGILIDLEENTARRFYGGTPKDNAAIEWRWAV